MFEDSTFESTGRIHTRSRGWMVATFAFNSAILMALILFPLLYPDALPHVWSAILMTAPAPQQEPPQPPPQQTAPARHVSSEMMEIQLRAPSSFPDKPYIPATREPPEIGSVAQWDMGSNTSGHGADVFRGQNSAVVSEAKKGPANVSRGVMEGLLIDKEIPEYPPVAKAMGVEGTVVLQASITKAGTIANLRVVSGPALLRQAAIDAVSRWVYRPYLLNGEPVEVETTVNVTFSLH
jgi:periplasmic protein TonB